MDQTIARYPTTGPIFLQRGDLHVALPGQLYVSYPARTLGAYAAVNALAIAPFLALLNAAAESEVAEETAPVPRPEEGDRGWRRLAPPVGSIGYTGSYTEPPADIVDVSVVSVLDARGPE